MKNFKQQAALNRVLSIIQAIDDERFHWMLNACHYSFKMAGKYRLTIWVETAEIAKTLKSDIIKLMMQDGDSIETRKCDSENTPYTVDITIEY